MTIQLRQVCLVARQLSPVIEDLTRILGIRSCYVDPGVGVFGLENTLLPVGRNFLEVVAPIREGTAGGRYLERRGGDGGYMVITQADTREAQQAVRRRALAAKVRIAHESDRPGWSLCQLHPADMVASFLEIEWDARENLAGYWMPAGGEGWEDKVDQEVTVDFLGVELQAPDGAALAELWSGILGLPVLQDSGSRSVRLNNATLTFVDAADGRGAGLGGVTLAVRNRGRILGEARRRGRYVTDNRVDICGVRFQLQDV
jgi:hypothetical protein